MPAMISVSPKSLGVKTAATPSSRRRRASRGRDDAADDDRDVVEAGCAQPVEHRRDQLHVRAGEDREPDAVHVLGHRGGDDLLGGQPDALVDHLEARRRGPGRRPARRRWSGRRARACRPAAAAGRRAPRRCAAPARAPAASSAPASADADGAGDAGRGPELAEHLAQRAGPLPRRRAGAGGHQRGLHQVGVGLGRLGAAGQRLARPRPRRARARHASRLATADRSASGSAAWIAASRSAVSGDGSVVS